MVEATTLPEPAQISFEIITTRKPVDQAENTTIPVPTMTLIPHLLPEN